MIEKPFTVLPYQDFLQSALFSKIDSFDCGDDDLNDFFKSDAESYHLRKLASTHVVCSDSDIVGFFTLVTDCMHSQRIQVSDSINDYPYLKYPAVKIARLAINLPYQNQGNGSWCMKRIFIALSRFSELAAFRFITVDAKNNADVIKFYAKFGFRPATQKRTDETLPMYIDYFALFNYVSK